MELTDRQSLEQWHEQQYLDDETPIDLPDHGLCPETVCAMLMLICSPAEGGAISWKPAFRRLAVIASHVLPDVGRYSLDAIADQLTTSGVPTHRATLSAINVLLSDATGFHRTEKSLAARESYRVAACRAWKKLPNRKTKGKQSNQQTVDKQ